MAEYLSTKELNDKESSLTCLKTLLESFQPDFLGYDSLAVRKKLSMLNHEKEILHLYFQDPSEFEANNEAILEQMSELNSELTYYEWEQKLLSYYQKGNLIDAAIYLCWINPLLKDEVKGHFQSILCAKTVDCSLNNEIKTLLMDHSINSVLEFGDCESYASLYNLNNALECWWHWYFTAYSDVVSKGASQDVSEFNNKLTGLIDGLIIS